MTDPSTIPPAQSGTPLFPLARRGRVAPSAVRLPSMNVAAIRARGPVPKAVLWRLISLVAIEVALFALVAIVPIGDARGGYSVFIGTEANRLLLESTLFVAPLVIAIVARILLIGVGKIPLVTLRRRDDVVSLRFRLARDGLRSRTMPLGGSVTLTLSYDPTKSGWDVVSASGQGKVVRTKTFGIVEKAELDAMAKAIRASGIDARVIVKRPGRPATAA